MLGKVRTIETNDDIPSNFVQDRYYTTFAGLHSGYHQCDWCNPCLWNW